MYIHIVSQAFTKTFYIPIFIEHFSENFILSCLYLNAMKVGPNKFYENNHFPNCNLYSIFLHIFSMIFTKLRILKLPSKAPKCIASR